MNISVSERTELRELAKKALGHAEMPYRPDLDHWDAWRAAAHPLKVQALLDALDAAEKDAQKWRRLEGEAAKYCEIPIAMRTDFTGDPPYVGWKGLGLAMEQAFDERDTLRARVATLEQALSEARRELDWAHPNAPSTTSSGSL